MEKFIDEIYLTVQSGKGGNGAVSFDRQKFRPIGKPNGGDGGDGGNVVIRIVPNLSELSHLTRLHLFKAKNGVNGGNNLKKGKNGEDAVILLPPGVIIKEFDSKKSIIELVKKDEEFIIVRGGKGGKGNPHFKSSTNRSPRRHDDGKDGISRKIIIELKLLADIGLVGFPNSGKSTLLDVMTDANPDINDYPFTTLTPNLGIFYDEYHTPYSIADIPGLIEGAHTGKGLGIQFLKHIERTKILCLIIDVSQQDYKKKQEYLLYELKSFKKDLIDKQIIFIGNKIDLLKDAKAVTKTSMNYIYISALKKMNIDELKKKLIGILRPSGSE